MALNFIMPDSGLATDSLAGHVCIGPHQVILLAQR
jgi:hypothetical protein